MEAPVVNVGIMTEKAVSFVFHGEYVHTETGKFLTGEQRALFVNGNIVYNGRLFKEIFFEPASPSSSFELKAVTIGRNFHWQRQEDQCFKGAFNLVTGENGIVVISSTADSTESPWTSLKSKNIPQKTCPGIWAVFSGDFCL